MPNLNELSDRELDALVAEKVMGWWLENNQYVTKNSKGMLVNTDYCDGNDDPTSGLMWWRPTDNIAQAWQVVEWMQNEMGSTREWMGKKHRDWFFALEAELNGWVAGIKYPEPYEGTYFNWERSAEADTAPRAICLAALKATMGGEDE